MAEARDPTFDPGVLEELQQALLEVAARKDALRAWPRELAPSGASERDPPVQARRDDDGTLGVFRFFTIADVGGSFVLDPVRDMTAEEARARIDGIGDKLKPGDEVGVELPLGRLAAIALADVEAVRAGRTHLLPARIIEMLGHDALADAVSARLSALRGPPPLVPLRRLVTDFGGDAVEWTAVCAGDAEWESGHHAGRPGELVVLVERGDEHKLVVVPTSTSAAGYAALLRALAPIPDDRSLWRFLEVEGPALLCSDEGSLWSDASAPSTPLPLGPPSASGEVPERRRYSLEVKTITIARDPSVYGVARARARLLTWSGAKIVAEQEATVGLPVDLPRFVDQAWPEGEALDRVLAAASSFRGALQHKLSALADAAPSTGPASVDDVLGGAAFLRVLARAAEGVFLHAELQSEPGFGAEPLNLRALEDGVADGREDEIVMRLADLGVLVLSPADDVVKLRTGDDDRELFVNGGLIDGDAEAWRALADTLAQAVADGDLDVELAFPSEDGTDTETVMLSAWLASLATREPRFPLRPKQAESAAALHVVVDRFVDKGPRLASDRSNRTDRNDRSDRSDRSDRTDRTDRGDRGGER